MATIGNKLPNKWRSKCGATIITNNTLLTAGKDVPSTYFTIAKRTHFNNFYISPLLQKCKCESKLEWYIDSCRRQRN